MAKITMIDIIKSASGKISGNSEYYLYTNKITGKQSVRRIGNDPNRKPTPKQEEQRKRLAEQSRLVHEWFEANKPSDSLPDGTERYREVVEAFRNQTEVGTINNYVRKLLREKKL